ncbi:hypothetical protein FH972_025389 [Carpinus fangiana]|uniref:Uncharacterized protein n=1 Tax=Carpinus fangiana TaxID=176857 RepID=A0A5N6L0Z9_9ROSI|nr:hypothetical protein FH972_025389 [Carpinus fangiana]
MGDEGLGFFIKPIPTSKGFRRDTCILFVVASREIPMVIKGARKLAKYTNCKAWGTIYMHHTVFTVKGIRGCQENGENKKKDITRLLFSKQERWRLGFRGAIGDRVERKG